MLKMQIIKIFLLIAPMLFFSQALSKKSCCDTKTVSSLCVKNNLTVGHDLNVCGTLTAAGKQIFSGIRSFAEFYNHGEILNAPQPLGVPILWQLADGSSGANQLNSSNFNLNSATGVITIANPGIYLLTFGARFKYDASTSVGPAEGEVLVILNGQALPFRITTGAIDLLGLNNVSTLPVVIFSEPVNSFLIQTTTPNSNFTINVTLENASVQFTSPISSFRSNAFLSIMQLN